MASWPLWITIISAKALKAHDVRLVASLSGDESNKKQCTPFHKKGSTDTWSGHIFEFTVEEAGLLNTRLEFKIECKKGILGRKTDVVGEVEVPVKDLLVLVKDLPANGCAGDMKPKVLSCEVRSSSTKTKEKTMAVLEYCYKFGERRAPLELEEDTVTANPAAAAPLESYTPPMPRPLMAYQQNAVPNYLAAPPPVVMGYAVGAYLPSTPRPQTAYQHNWDPMAYVPNATPPQAGYRPPAPPLPHPGGGLLGRVGIGVAVNQITSVLNDLRFDGVDFADGGF